MNESSYTREQVSDTPSSSYPLSLLILLKPSLGEIYISVHCWFNFQIFHFNKVLMNAESVQHQVLLHPPPFIFPGLPVFACYIRFLNLLHMHKFIIFERHCSLQLILSFFYPFLFWISLLVLYIFFKFSKILLYILCYKCVGVCVCSFTTF